jgi:predicted O-methyltransferase YrrM
MTPEPLARPGHDGLEYLEGLVHQTWEAGYAFEYGCDRIQHDWLSALAAAPGISLICETGFNAGYSSHAFLTAQSASTVYSFDLVQFEYSTTAHRYLRGHFGPRHHLIHGDSRQTVPDFHRLNPDLKFDLIFIDGGHSYDVARADLANLRALATPSTIVIMDDMTPWNRVGIGPTNAWVEAMQDGSIRHEALLKDGEQVTAFEPSGSRSWAVGRYLF